MKLVIGTLVVVAALVLVGGPAYAQMGWGPGYGYGMAGPGMMGPATGMMGPGMGMMGGGPCSGTAGAATAMTLDRAKEVAQEYANEYLKGYTVETVLPFATPMGWTVYSVELKGPKDEVRTLHVNPWGNVMPFGGPGRRTG